MKKFVLVIFVLVSLVTISQVKLPQLVSDGMVLQRDVELKIWGWSSPSENISIQFLETTYETQANENGEWEVLIPKQKAGGPYEMIISASNTIILNDILIGDVWVCSGQSNMELTMQRVSWVYPDEIADSENNYIRHFEVPDKYDFKEPQKDLTGGKWVKANPQYVLDFSAVGYFFAKELYDKYQVPIGLINSSLGGSPAQAWLSEESLKQLPGYYDEAKRFRDDSLIEEIESSDQERMNDWYSKLDKKDEGFKTWYKPDVDLSDWPRMNVPGHWSDTDLGDVNGVVWFRKDLELPSSLAEKKAELILGAIVDADSTFINGIYVGNTTYRYPPRRYQVPQGILKQGKNSIVIRVVNSSGKGGFVFDKDYEIQFDKDTIDLKGEWYYKLGATMEPLASQTFIRWKPLGLYNAMINPLINYKMKGVIWNQGESNASKPKDYTELMTTLINDWRNKWGQGDFPFLFVQLASFMESKDQPSESNWALLREAQLNTLSVKNTGMAVTIDIGEWNDIHPLNKKDVGKRLALAAQKIAYGEDVVYSGPIYSSMTIKGNKIILSFDNIGSGLVTKGDGPLKQFAIAGADKRFVWANAEILDNMVIVYSDEIENPIAVRYAWADNPEGANLFNKEGLPASPFRTDDF